MRERIELRVAGAPHPNPLPAGGARGLALLGLEGNRDVAASVLLPVITGRRWRQPDEGQPLLTSTEGANVQ